jgi:hypothetical protein
MARPDLVAVDDVVITVARGHRLERQEIGAGVGLAEALEERGLAAGDARQHLALQTLAAVLNDGVARRPAVGERSKGRAGPGQLLEQDELVHQRPLLAAEGAGPAHRQPALLGEGTEAGARVRAGAIAGVHAVMGKLGRWMRAQEAAHLFGERLLVRAPSEVHGAVTLLQRGTERHWPRGT